VVVGPPKMVPKYGLWRVCSVAENGSRFRIFVVFMRASKLFLCLVCGDS